MGDWGLGIGGWLMGSGYWGSFYSRPAFPGRDHARSGEWGLGVSDW